MNINELTEDFLNELLDKLSKEKKLCFFWVILVLTC